MMFGAASAAVAVATLCIKLHQQYDLVKRYHKDCGKLNELVQGVERVLHTAAETGADMTTKQWSHALESLRDPLLEVGEVFAACQKTGIIASMLNGKELNMRLDRVNSRLMLALQLIPIQQHSASARRLQLQIADLKDQVQTAQYASARSAAEQSDQLERMLQSIMEQQQQQQRDMKEQHNMLQAQNQQLQQQLQQQQQAFMLQLANLMQSAAPAQQQQQGPGRQPVTPAVMNTQQLEAELADLQSCLQTAQHQHQPQQEQYLRQTIQFVEQLQHHHKTQTLHLAFGDLAQLQQRAAQTQQPQQQRAVHTQEPAQAASRAESYSRSAGSPVGYSSLQRNSTGANNSRPNSHPLGGFAPAAPLAVPVVSSVATVVPSVKQRVQVLEGTGRVAAASSAAAAVQSLAQHNGAQSGVQLVAQGNRAPAGQQLAVPGVQKTGQASAPLLSGSMMWDGPAVPTVSRTSSIVSNGSSGSGMSGSMAGQHLGDVGRMRSSSRAMSLLGNGTNNTGGSGSSVPVVLFEVTSGDSEDAMRRQGSSSSAPGISSPHGVMQQVMAVQRSYSSRSASETWDVRSPDQTAAAVAAAVKGTSTADVGGARQWQAALAAAKGKPDAVVAWRLFAFALQDQHKIDLSCQDLSDKDIQAISLHAAPFWMHATTVNLSHNRIGPVGVAALAQHAAKHWKQLIHLDLSGNSIGPEGAAALARQAAQHWNRLQHLLLKGSAVGNAGAQALAQHGAAHWPGIVVLSLQNNGINSRGAAALAEPAILSRWRQMQRLDLRGNSISKECAEILHMAATRMWGRSDTILV